METFDSEQQAGFNQHRCRSDTSRE